MSQNDSPPNPENAHTPAEFVQLLQQLRAWSGLTYREMETRAEQHGQHLARSTAAAILRRDTLPRAEFVHAYVTVCGLSPIPWVDARRRIATAFATASEYSAVSTATDYDAGATAVPAPASIPAQLPCDIADFTGRESQFDVIRDELTQADGLSAAVPVVGISGMGGVGKTSLVVHAAHALSEWFPDGQLFVDLQGNGPAPTDPCQVLARFLRTLGVPGPAVPDSLDEQSALYRTLLADRKILVVLDNAYSEHQVRPLLPGSAGPAVLTTSRSRLVGLGPVRLVDLDTLSFEDGTTMLSRILGPNRIATDPAAVAGVVELCGRSPLAIRIAGARLASRHQWPLRQMVTMLRDEQRRLDELTAGDLAVRSSFALSYEALPEPTRRVFRLLGLLRVPYFPAWAAAALLDCPVGSVGTRIEVLVDAGLLTTTTTGGTDCLRYRMHDLVHLYARERATCEEPVEQQNAALDRALGAWLWLAERFTEQIPGPCYATLHGTAPRWPVYPNEPENHDHDAMTWFDVEFEALTALVEQACRDGREEFAWDLSGCLEKYVNVRGVDCRSTHETALAACRKAGNRRGEAVLMRGLADHSTWVSHEPGEVAMSTQLHQAERALELFRELDEKRGMSDALTIRAWALVAHGCHEHARTSIVEAVAVADAADHLGGLARAHHIMAIVAHEEGETHTSIYHLDRTLSLAQQLGNLRLEATAIQFLGAAYTMTGTPEAGRQYLTNALTKARELNDPYVEAFSLLYLARLELHTGASQANQYAWNAAEISRHYGFYHHLADALGLLGELELCHGDPEQAVRHLEESVQLWKTRGWQSFLAQALNSLSRAYSATRQVHRARDIRDEARRLSAGFSDAGSDDDPALAHPPDGRALNEASGFA